MATGISSLEGPPPASGDGANLDEYGAPYSDQANAEHGRALDLLRSDTHAAVNVSYMQTKLRMPFNRTQRLLERLEREGVVGPPKSDGYNGRVVLEIPASTGVSPLLPDEVDGARELLVQGERIAAEAQRDVAAASSAAAEIEAELSEKVNPCAKCGEEAAAIARHEGDGSDTASVRRAKVESHEGQDTSTIPPAANDANAEAHDKETEGQAAQGSGHPAQEAAAQELQRPSTSDKDTSTERKGNTDQAVEGGERSPQSDDLAHPVHASGQTATGHGAGTDASSAPADTSGSLSAEVSRVQPEAPAAGESGPAPLSMAGRKWGHNGKGSAWHVWAATVETSVGEGGVCIQTAPCNEEVQGTILYADRPIADNACLDCAAMVGWSAPLENLAESAGELAQLPEWASVGEGSPWHRFKSRDSKVCDCRAVKRTHNVAWALGAAGTLAAPDGSTYCPTTVAKEHSCKCGQEKRSYSWRGHTETKTNQDGLRVMHGWGKCVQLCKIPDCTAPGKAELKGHCGRHRGHAAAPAEAVANG